MYQAQNRRQLGLTDKQLLGTFPDETRVGDLVVIFLGAAMPFVLRAVGENYQLVGACYVHGIMDGELVEVSKETEGVKINGQPVCNFTLL
ncbi:hypothetical protein K458DRAFT_113171 [Lentithecium fluviatile CBS 122367]|uniref:Uncharacterized protein n=1 Tax=Lentithecium fluviatile CBS 122367 TaxID=1168545 RepID=A0A6G1IP11_9PLEO|nr:hypothetical protein K458DRAFT_113171 [Lentithecium fluviatile CBS 122367]